MKVYVPSMGRASSALYGPTSTLGAIPNAVLVVPDDQLQAYGRVARSGTEVLACPAKGIAKTRLWIGRYAQSAGEKTFCMMDDDLNFSRRVSETDTKLQRATGEDVAQMLAWMDVELRRYAHVSISVRQNNNNGPIGNSASAVGYNMRTLRVLAYQTRPFLEMRHGRVEVMEDFDVNLQLLRSGHANVQSFWWAQDQRGTGAKGGCSTYRTLEVQDRSARELARLHEPFVKLRVKENKTGPEALRKRTEVTIFWKKAAAEGGCD